MHYLADLELRSLKRVCLQGYIPFGDSEDYLPTCLFEFLETAHISWLRASSSSKESCGYIRHIWQSRIISFQNLSLNHICKITFTILKVKVLVTQSCLALCDPIDYHPQSSSSHGIPQARILEWVASSSSRVSSWPRDQTQFSCIASRLFTVWVIR